MRKHDVSDPSRPDEAAEMRTSTWVKCLSVVKFPGRLSSDGAFVLLLIGIFGVTNQWYSWSGGINYLHGGDVRSYEAMAEAAPGLPTGYIGSAYTERFIIHYVTGNIATLVRLDVHIVYRILWGLVVVGLVAAVVAALHVLSVTGLPFKVALTILVLNPYALRYYAIVPGMLADIVFELGIAVALLGMVSRRLWVLLAGALLASISRQTALLTVPLLAVWLLLDRGWQLRGRRVVATMLLLLPWAIYGLVKIITAPFTKPFAPRIPADTILPLFGDLPSSASILASHALRVVAPLLVVIALFITAVIVRHTPRRLDRSTWMFLAVGVTISAQALIISPSFPGFEYNEPRISALGLVPFVLALGMALPARSTIPSPRGSAAAIVLWLVLVGASLHHIYSVVGPQTTTQFTLLQCAAAACATTLIALLFRSIPNTTKTRIRE